MQAVFEESAQEHRLLGPVAYIRFVPVELGKLVLHAAVAQFASVMQKGYLENQVPVRATLPPPEDLPAEVLQAQNRVAVNLNRLQFAISHHQFVPARYYFNEERQVREKYGIGDSA